MGRRWHRASRESRSCVCGFQPSGQSRVRHSQRNPPARRGRVGGSSGARLQDPGYRPRSPRSRPAGCSLASYRDSSKPVAFDRWHVSYSPVTFLNLGTHEAAAMSVPMASNAATARLGNEFGDLPRGQHCYSVTVLHPCYHPSPDRHVARGCASARVETN